MNLIVKNWDENDIKTASCMIENSGLILAPTDTIYALICGYDDPEASEKIYKIKKRDHDKPLILFVDNLTQAKLYGEFDEYISELIQYYWPGPLTIIVKKIDSDKLIGFRKTSNLFINKIISFINKPILATSVNISGEEAAIYENDINPIIKENIDGIFNISDVEPSGKNSTIIIYEKKSLKLLREGEIKFKDILAKFPFNIN